jgi:hypothetical protein
MTLEWIPLDALEPHPENSNRMPPGLLTKLKGHIRRTGLYEPLIVRPITERGTQAEETEETTEGRSGRSEPGNDLAEAGGGSDVVGGDHAEPSGVPRSEFRVPSSCRYQLLNGHHRAEALRQLGHTHARCDVWLVDDNEARVLLATLNRLEGRDDPTARAKLVARLAAGRSAEEIARLLPEPADAVERLLALAQPPPAPLDPNAAAPLARPMTFFLSQEQQRTVAEALREIIRVATAMAVTDDNGLPEAPPSQGDEAPASCNDEAPPSREREPAGTSAADQAPSPESDTRELTVAARAQVEAAPTRRPRLPRADALERLATWFLEARNLR